MLTDSFQRRISYLRLSVTDRCDLRCVYCMAEDMTFLPKADLLTLEELDRVASAFVALGTRKLRITGGEPLVRKGVMELIEGLARHLASGALDELTLTTNGTKLAAFAGRLAAAGVQRINVSLDTLKPDLFRALTRGGGTWMHPLIAEARDKWDDPAEHPLIDRRLAWVVGGITHQACDTVAKALLSLNAKSEWNLTHEVLQRNPLVKGREGEVDPDRVQECSAYYDAHVFRKVYLDGKESPFTSRFLSAGRLPWSSRSRSEMALKSSAIMGKVLR